MYGTCVYVLIHTYASATKKLHQMHVIEFPSFPQSQGNFYLFLKRHTNLYILKKFHQVYMIEIQVYS